MCLPGEEDVGMKDLLTGAVVALALQGSWLPLPSALVAMVAGPPSMVVAGGQPSGWVTRASPPDGAVAAQTGRNENRV